MVNILVVLTSKVRLSNEEETFVSAGFAIDAFAVTDPPSVSEIILLAASMYSSCEIFECDSEITVCREGVDEREHVRLILEDSRVSVNGVSCVIDPWHMGNESSGSDQERSYLDILYLSYLHSALY